MSFASAVAFVLEREGGFVNDAADRGGATKYGITHRTLAAARGRATATVDDVRQLRITEAVAIYESRYWLDGRCEAIEAEGLSCLALCHFDAAVNHGVRRAIQILQLTLGVEADGAFGPVTAAAAIAQRDAEGRLVTSYLIERARFFRSIAQDQSQAKFLRGWLARCRHVARECGVAVHASFALDSPVR